MATIAHLHAGEVEYIEIPDNVYQAILSRSLFQHQAIDELLGACAEEILAWIVDPETSILEIVSRIDQELSSKWMDDIKPDRRNDLVSALTAAW